MLDLKDLDLSDPQKVDAFTRKFEQLFGEGVKEEIKSHKAAGNPIYYSESQEGVLIKEMPDGIRYAIKIGADGEDEILQKLT